MYKHEIPFFLGAFLSDLLLLGMLINELNNDSAAPVGIPALKTDKFSIARNFIFNTDSPIRLHNPFNSRFNGLGWIRGDLTIVSTTVQIYIKLESVLFRVLGKMFLANYSAVDLREHSLQHSRGNKEKALFCFS